MVLHNAQLPFKAPPPLAIKKAPPALQVLLRPAKKPPPPLKAQPDGGAAAMATAQRANRIYEASRMEAAAARFLNAPTEEARGEPLIELRELWQADLAAQIAYDSSSESEGENPLINGDQDFMQSWRLRRAPRQTAADDGASGQCSPSSLKPRLMCNY